MTQDQYVAMVQALLPEGIAWPRRPDAVLTQLLSAWADEYTRFDGRVDGLLAELLPTRVSELIPDWERVLALPDACCGNLTQDISQRAAAIRAKFAAIGGQSRQYFLNVAAAFGYPFASLDEFVSGVNCDSTCDSALWSVADRFTWRLNLFGTPSVTTLNCDNDCNTPLQTWNYTNAAQVTQASCDSRCDTQLSSWAIAAMLMCAINRFKPAHTTVVFNYA